MLAVGAEVEGVSRGPAGVEPLTPMPVPPDLVLYPEGFLGPPLWTLAS